MARTMIHVSRCILNERWYASEGEYGGPPQPLGWGSTPLGAAEDLMYDLGLDPHSDPFVMLHEGSA